MVTTTTVNLGIGLANEGHKVLIIDFDHHGDITTCLGFKQIDDLDVTIASLMADSFKGNKIDFAVAIKHHEEHVDFIPSNINLADLEMPLNGNLISFIQKEVQS